MNYVWRQTINIPTISVCSILYMLKITNIEIVQNFAITVKSNVVVLCICGNYAHTYKY